MRFRAVALMLGVLALVLVFAGSAQAALTPGSSGLGDPFFPLAGNGGYDVRHYALTIGYDPAPANSLRGRATIEAAATENLYRFDLDLRQFLAVSHVTVDGRTRRSSSRRGRSS